MTSKFRFGTRSAANEPAAPDSRTRSSTGRNGATGYSTRDVGMLLRERREAMGVSLAEAEAATRIRQKYLAALESDEWHLLPGEVVGRGFLRNYAGYLGLEPTDVIERRRVSANERLGPSLANTSAGAPLPPIRQVDYRPKEVDLKDEPEGIERREINLRPFLAVLTGLLVISLLWWGGTRFGEQIGDGLRAMQTRVAAAFDAPPATATPLAPVGGIVNPENTQNSQSTAAQDSTAAQAGDAAAAQPPAGDTSSAQAPQQESQPAALILVPTSTPTPGPPEPTPTPQPEPVATDTPIPLPTPTPRPETALLPTPTPQPAAVEEAPVAEAVVEEEAPAEEEEPEEPVIVPAACPDQRAVIASPGVNQTVSGTLSVLGTATHEAFQYYKLEYAPGANAAGGFVYFDGRNSPVENGLLGSLNTTALPNGTYTIQIVVVDQTGNFPAPCRVSFQIQN